MMYPHPFVVKTALFHRSSILRRLEDGMLRLSTVHASQLPHVLLEGGALNRYLAMFPLPNESLRHPVSQVIIVLPSDMPRQRA